MWLSNVKFQQWYSFEYDNLERLEEALASDFAYDKDQAFFQKSLGHHFMTFGRGFASGGMQLAGYGKFYDKIKIGDVRQGVGAALFSSTFAMEYALYGLQKAIGPKYNFYGNGASQKMGIYHNKALFYSLTIK